MDTQCETAIALVLMLKAVLLDFAECYLHCRNTVANVFVVASSKCVIMILEQTKNRNKTKNEPKNRKNKREFGTLDI